MKHLKAKLMASIMSLALAIAMLASASFAWFTISTAPEIKEFTTQVVTNENLEIALAKGTKVPGAAALGDTGNAYTWGNLVDLGAGDAGDNFTAFTKDPASKTNIRPSGLGTVTDVDGKPKYIATTNASETDGQFMSPKYGKDGRVETLVFMSSETNFKVSDEETGFGSLIGPDGKVYGYYIDYWLRSNVGGQVVLADARERGDESSEKGEGSFFISNRASSSDITLTKNIRIAFRKLGEQKMDADGFATEEYVVDTNNKAGYATPATTGALASETDAGKVVAYKCNFTGDVVELEPNVGALVRMFVYLDGDQVTNAAASIDGVVVGGKLNVQFAIEETETINGVTKDKAMQVPTKTDIS